MQAKDPTVTTQTALDLGLTKEEYERIGEILGRLPNFTELGAFSVLWSERCSYKNARFWLRSLPRAEGRLDGSPDAPSPRLISLGEGLNCLLHFESIPRPGYPENWPGSVGNLLRQSAARGAQPLAFLTAFFLGGSGRPATDTQWDRTRTHLEATVSLMEVPMPRSWFYYDAAYEEHPVANILSVGLSDNGIAAVTGEADNPVFIAGAPVGVEGLDEVSFALAAPAEVKSPAGKESAGPAPDNKLPAAIRQVLKTGAVVGIQAIGPGGLAGAAVEMCAAAGTGMLIDLDRVPVLYDDLLPFEILLSESAGRLLLVGKKGMEPLLGQAFAEVGLIWQAVGEVTRTGRLEVFHHGRKAADLPVHPLARSGAPIYQREYSRPTHLKKNDSFKASRFSQPDNYPETARRLWTSIAGRNYGLFSAASSATDPADAVLLPLEAPDRMLAVALQGNPAYASADPQTGAMIAAAGAARQIICSGGEPLAFSTCLNFGNPYQKEVYWQFVQAVKGIGEVCKKLNIPVADSQVRFYNQSIREGGLRPIPATPVIALLGSTQRPMFLGFRETGHQIYMIGTPTNDLACSEYLRLLHGVTASPPPRFDLDEELHIQQNLRKLIREARIESAHTISEGGLFVALIEAALARGLGFNIETDNNFRKDAYLFGEGQNRTVISVTSENEDDLVNFLNSHNVSFTKLGEVAGDRIVIDEEDYGRVAEWQGPVDPTFQEKTDA